MKVEESERKIQGPGGREPGTEAAVGKTEQCSRRLSTGGKIQLEQRKQYWKRYRDYYFLQPCGFPFNHAVVLGCLVVWSLNFQQICAVAVYVPL